MHRVQQSQVRYGNDYIPSVAGSNIASSIPSVNNSNFINNSNNTANGSSSTASAIPAPGLSVPPNMNSAAYQQQQQYHLRSLQNYPVNGMILDHLGKQQQQQPSQSQQQHLQQPPYVTAQHQFSASNIPGKRRYMEGGMVGIEPIDMIHRTTTPPSSSAIGNANTLSATDIPHQVYNDDFTSLHSPTPPGIGISSQHQQLTQLQGSTSSSSIGAGIRQQGSRPGSSLGVIPQSKSPTNLNNELYNAGMLNLINMLKVENIIPYGIGNGVDLADVRLGIYPSEFLSSVSHIDCNCNSKNANYQIPNCYPSSISIGSDPISMLKKGKMSTLSMETLLYTFYFMPQDLMQILATKELYARGWIYHSELRAWFRESSSQDGGDRQLLYFDESNWEIRPFLSKIPPHGLIPTAEINNLVEETLRRVEDGRLDTIATPIVSIETSERKPTTATTIVS